MSNELRAETTVPVPPERAFALFTTGFAQWWPREFSWSGAYKLEQVGIDDGVLYEIGPHGLRWDWGRVLAWAPPRGLTFSWQIGPDRVPIPDADSASEVVVSFTPVADGCRVVVVHRRWDRHGKAGQAYREAFGPAWEQALRSYAEAAGRL
jgi:uncharacterized protein YndB with AHSA1/START domain